MYDVLRHPQAGKLHFFELLKDKKGVAETVSVSNNTSPVIDQGIKANKSLQQPFFQESYKPESI